MSKHTTWKFELGAHVKDVVTRVKGIAVRRRIKADKGARLEMRYAITYGRTTLIELAEVHVEAETEHEALEKAATLRDELTDEELDWEQTDISHGAEIHVADVQQVVIPL